MVRVADSGRVKLQVLMDERAGLRLGLGLVLVIWSVVGLNSRSLATSL